jgi:hypothetical protein
LDVPLEFALHNSFRLWAIRFGAEFPGLRITFVDHPRRLTVTTIEAVMLGMMLSWTPCVLLMAYLLWRAPLELDCLPSVKSAATDQIALASKTQGNQRNLNYSFYFPARRSKGWLAPADTSRTAA